MELLLSTMVVTLYGSTAWRHGRPSKPQSGHKSPLSAWDFIVQDLLSVAANVPGKKPARGTSTAVQVATSHFNNFLNYDQWFCESEDFVTIFMTIVQAQNEMPD